CITNNNSVKNSEINYTINYTVSRTISNNHEQRSTRFNRYHFPAIRYEAGGCSPIWGSPPTHSPHTGIFFRLNVNQAGGLYIPLITVMMIQVRTFSPSGVKAPTVTMFVVVALMVCVVIMTIQNLKGDVSDLLKLRLPEISTG
ncbi:hypothetical protein AX350_005400, partial [Escherichia coli]|nr:hypothetical protein [Escherichia coli]